MFGEKQKHQKSLTVIVAWNVLIDKSSPCERYHFLLTANGETYPEHVEGHDKFIFGSKELQTTKPGPRHVDVVRDFQVFIHRIIYSMFRIYLVTPKSIPIFTISLDTSAVPRLINIQISIYAYHIHAIAIS